MVKQCVTCVKKSTPPLEPLISTELPQYPWQKIATDLFTLRGINYLLVVDYFSRYPEVVKLTNTTSSSVVHVLKSLFSRYGIPETVVSDNGPQYSSQEFAQFARAYNFSHITSSPYFPQSNGMGERTVKTMKTETDDPYMAILATPFPWCILTPAELLMGRRLRSNLPVHEDQLIPKWDYLKEFRCQNKIYKTKQKQQYDLRHRVLPLDQLPEDSEVFITTNGRVTSGQVVTPVDAPRSYLINTSSGLIRRNRRDLTPIPDGSSQPNGAPETVTNQIMTRSRTGTSIHPPNRLTSFRKGDVV